ncbi:MAG: type II secretion system protein GspL [Planctomycetota bacterium]|nr:type II secretion system protein GspL [Planctomycetota bacterium]
MKTAKILVALQSDRYIVARPEGDGVTLVREIPRASNDDAAADQTLAQTLAELGAGSRGICLGLPGEMVLATAIDLDGLPRRRRHAAMLYRLEEHLPLDIETVTAVFLPPAGGKALALAVRTEPLRAIVKGLALAGIGVDAVCPTALLALQEAGRKGFPPADHVIVPGAGSTDIFRLVNGLPVAWYTASAEQAEWVRCLEADLLEHPAADPRPPLVLGPALEGVESFGAPASPALLSASTEPAISLAARGAAAVMSGKMAPWADFRQGALAGSGSWLGADRLVRTAAALAVLFLLTLTATFYIVGVQYGQVASGYESRQEAEFHRLLPTSPLPPSIPSRLKSEAARLAALSGAGGETPELPNALETLRRIAAGLPANVRLKITNLQVRPGEISIEGEAPVHTDAEALAQGLSREGLVVDAPRTENKAAGGVAFTITGRTTGKEPPARKAENAPPSEPPTAAFAAPGINKTGGT